MPVAIHPMSEHPKIRAYQRFDGMKQARWMQNALGMQGPQQAFYGLFQWGLFDRFPEVKTIVLESGAGWIGASLDRMDATYETSLGDSVPPQGEAELLLPPAVLDLRRPRRDGPPAHHRPRRERPLLLGDRLPHFDHPENYMDELERLVSGLSETTGRNLLGDAVTAAYDL